jgi:hypothetical protein
MYGMEDKVFGKESEEKCAVGRPTYTWEDNIKMYSKEMR